CGLAPLQLRLVLCCAVSWINCASSRLIRAWTSSSISRKVAFGWLHRHSVISVKMCSLSSRQCSSDVWSMVRLHVLVFPSYPFLFDLSTPLQKFDAHPICFTGLCFSSKYGMLFLSLL